MMMDMSALVMTLHEIDVELHDGTRLHAPMHPHPCTYIRWSDEMGRTLGMMEQLQVKDNARAAIRALAAPGSSAMQPIAKYVRTRSGRTLDVVVEGEDAYLRVGDLGGDEFLRLSDEQLSADPVMGMAQIIGQLAVGI